jgi:hypothetical protein
MPPPTDKISAIALIVSTLAGGGVGVSYMDLNSDVAVNKAQISANKELKEEQFEFIQKELSEIKQLVKEKD